jgi:hypothetical protein
VKEMNKKIIALIVVAVVAVALVATGLVLLMGHHTGTPASNQNPSTGTTSSGVSIDQATSAVQSYLGRMGYSNLAIGTMQEYSNMYYAQIVEQNNGTGAFELSVNKTTGVVTPMQGPTMMWNTKYGVTSNGMMGYLTSTSGSGGMMGGGGMMTWLRGTPTTNMTISVEQAKALAQQYLDANYTGTTAGQVTTYYGYYTMQVLKDGNPFGMMAVYGNTGQVMYYSSMGTFMQQKVFG